MSYYGGFSRTRFIQRQTDRRQTGGRTTTSFIRDQLDTLERQLMASEIRIREWREGYKFYEFMNFTNVYFDIRIDAIA